MKATSDKRNTDGATRCQSLSLQSLFNLWWDGLRTLLSDSTSVDQASSLCWRQTPADLAWFGVRRTAPAPSHTWSCLALPPICVVHAACTSLLNNHRGSWHSPLTIQESTGQEKAMPMLMPYDQWRGWSHPTTTTTRCWPNSRKLKGATQNLCRYLEADVLPTESIVLEKCREVIVTIFAMPVVLPDISLPRRCMIACEGTIGGKVCEQTCTTSVGNV